MTVVFKQVRALTALLAAALALAGCGASADTAGNAGAGSSPEIVASFYPLQWISRQVAGPDATVESLTKPGAEPHDLELTPQDVAKVSDADLVVYSKGFQPAVDDAVDQEAGDRGFDVSRAAHLNLTYTPIEEGEAHTDQAGAKDPHFWLDPVRLAAVADAVATRLAKIDPAHAARYRTHAAAVTGKLETLNQDFKAGLADCANKDLVTSHNAFGYLAQRYGLTQVGITGLTPDEEPKPGDLAAVTEFVRSHHVQTIYYETLVSPSIAKTVAAETGAATAVLDPIEGLTRDSQGTSYLQVMRANLANIEKGQPCS